MTIPVFTVANFPSFKKCTLTYGHFNSVHPGHIRYLKNAASKGNSLIVAIIPDTIHGKKRSYKFSQRERAEGLTAINIVDGIILLEDEENALEKAINKLKPNLLVLGTEFENSVDPEIINAISVMKKQGLAVQFHAGEIRYASTNLLENSESDIEEDNKTEFRMACKRQNLKKEELMDFIDSWVNTKLLVVGDTILDQYAGCEALGMSAEAPVLVVRELQKKNFIGGASIVASHLKALGADCSFLSVVGNDDNAKIVKKALSDQGIDCELIKDSSRPTTFKKRYLVENQKLFRVSRLNDHFLDKSIEKRLIKKLEKISPNVDGIIVSDFVYGVITPKVLDKIVELSKKHNLRIFGDTQCSSQIGLVTKFKNFTLICPNEREARIALQDKESGLESISTKLFSSTNSEMLVMKLGAQGFIAFDPSLEGLTSQSFPALCANPVDVSGAGDSLIAVMATALSTKREIMPAAALGCCMAAIAVEKMGNNPIDASQLKDFLGKLL